MTYNDFLVRLDALALQGLDDARLPASVPAIIDAAEQRIYREVDFLSTTARDASLSLTSGVRELAYTAAVPFVTLQSLNVVLRGARFGLAPMNREVLDVVYGSPTAAGMPRWFAVLDDRTLMVGPWPDQAYPVEIYGTIRPVPLYKAGSAGSTFLSANLPDLFFAAAMSFVDTLTGKTSENPQWEATYQAAKASADMEEARKKFQSAGWSSLSAPKDATTTR